MPTEDNPFPGELKGWNWGASLLGGIWAAGNGVWIGLLAFIPYVGIVMSILLGAKGNEWAWRSRKWESIEHFRKTQRTWAWWGVGVSLFGLTVSLAYIKYVFSSLSPIFGF
ncbi:MAG: ribonuclease G [Dehalococcoidia bacterium]|nr:ribonuclease G [Dehalococcoidia bacterium]